MADLHLSRTAAVVRRMHARHTSCLDRAGRVRGVRAARSGGAVLHRNSLHRMGCLRRRPVHRGGAVPGDRDHRPGPADQLARLVAACPPRAGTEPSPLADHRPDPSGRHRDRRPVLRRLGCRFRSFPFRRPWALPGRIHRRSRHPRSPSRRPTDTIRRGVGLADQLHAVRTHAPTERRARPAGSRNPRAGRRCVRHRHRPLHPPAHHRILDPGDDPARAVGLQPLRPRQRHTRPRRRNFIQALYLPVIVLALISVAWVIRGADERITPGLQPDGLQHRESRTA